MTANELLRQAVAQPVLSHAQQLDIVALEPDFFAQFPVHGVHRVLAGKHATLRKLPAFVAGATAEQQLAVIVRENDPDVGAEPFCVNQIVAHSNRY